MRQIVQLQLPEIKLALSKYQNVIKKYEVLLNRGKCTGCGKCMVTCPEYIGSAPIDYEAFQKSEGILRIIHPTYFIF